MHQRQGQRHVGGTWVTAVVFVANCMLLFLARPANAVNISVSNHRLVATAGEGEGEVEGEGSCTADASSGEESTCDNNSGGKGAVYEISNWRCRTSGDGNAVADCEFSLVAAAHNPQNNEGNKAVVTTPGTGHVLRHCFSSLDKQEEHCVDMRLVVDPVVLPHNGGCDDGTPPGEACFSTKPALQQQPEPEQRQEEQQYVSPQALYERGLTFVGHLNKLLATRSHNADSPKPTATFVQKWKSIQDKAQSTLRDALMLFMQEERASASASEVEAEASARRRATMADIRHLLQRLIAGDLAPPLSSSTHSQEPPEESLLQKEQRGLVAMNRGLQFASHLKQLVQAATDPNDKGKEEDNERHLRAAATMAKKWQLIHHRAVQSLEEAMQLFQQLVLATAATHPHDDDDDDDKPTEQTIHSHLHQASQAWDELHQHLLPPPPLPSPAATETKLVPEKEESLEVLWQRAQAAHEQGRRFWLHLSQFQEAAGDYKLHPERWNAKWTSIHSKARESLQEAVALFSRLLSQPGFDQNGVPTIRQELQQARELLQRVQESTWQIQEENSSATEYAKAGNDNGQ